MIDFKKDFPFFSYEKNRDLIYFDNAATTQKPKCVIDAIKKFYECNNANPLRGLYAASVRATDAYENARKTVADFIGAKETSEIIFTRNASESLNLVAFTYGMENVLEGDEIVVSVMEHHSNFLPWQMLAKKKNARLVFLECDKKNFEIAESEIQNKITAKTKIVAIAHVSNVLGVTNDVKKIAKRAHEVGAVIVVDGAQAVPHTRVRVSELDADFYAFSAHKMVGPNGIGVLYGKKKLLEAMPPFLRGGEMIEYVTREDATWAEVPHKFEAGTVNTADAVATAEAIRYIENIGFTEIEKRDNDLTQFILDGMKKIPHVQIIGNEDAKKHCGIIAFSVDNVHPHDISSILDSEGIAVRAGHHCAQVLGSFLGIQASARASVYFYNTEEEAAKFLSTMKKVRSWMGLKD